MLRILGRGTSGNVQKVVWLLEELGEQYVREDYGRQFNNTQTAEYLALNPHAKVPTLLDGELAVWESNTILRYVCNKLLKGRELYPAEPGARSQVERWMDWQLAALNAPYLGVFREAKKKPEERGANFAADAKELATQLELLEKGTAGRAFIAGSAFSIADVCLGPIIDRVFGFPISLPDLPGLRGWHMKVTARPAYQKSKG
jgi:glutathione S-transferase